MPYLHTESLQSAHIAHLIASAVNVLGADADTKRHNLLNICEQYWGNY